jgi:hypothetical protein
VEEKRVYSRKNTKEREKEEEIFIHEWPRIATKEGKEKKVSRGDAEARRKRRGFFDRINRMGPERGRWFFSSAKCR